MVSPVGKWITSECTYRFRHKNKFKIITYDIGVCIHVRSLNEITKCHTYIHNACTIWIRWANTHYLTNHNEFTVVVLLCSYQLQHTIRFDSIDTKYLYFFFTWALHMDLSIHRSVLASQHRTFSVRYFHFSAFHDIYLIYVRRPFSEICSSSKNI